MSCSSAASFQAAQTEATVSMSQDLPGFPKRADDILEGLEESDGKGYHAPSAPSNEARETGLDLFASPIINELADLDVMSKTPIEAMEILFRLSKEAKESR